eukprot:CAMPEP_0179941846 /NCGR_PEP_ID=MMETSP0983-20121128/17249_1 /TAXON_ID=483367 /ORGANISM="non described non described, Strain CCMP 2436" /LENGTH=56 /DNA_ID=CAMNT_0021849005 /DNA_START=208 /DNA_END=378 /DNA_ORIENTATION=+
MARVRDGRMLRIPWAPQGRARYCVAAPSYLRDRSLRLVFAPCAAKGGAHVCSERAT